MILEHVLIEVAAERSDDYLAAFAEARPLVLRQPGCRSCRLLPRLEGGGNFLLLIEWEQVEDHTKGFRRSADYRRWSELLHPFYDVFPTVNYFIAP